MKALAPLREPDLKPPKGARYAARVRDPKTKQELVVTSAEPIAAYCLDDDHRVPWPHGEGHTDAVLIAELDGSPVVLFIELTQSLQLAKKRGSQVEVDPMVRKTKQLDGAVAHFHPAARTGAVRSHGDEHHDAWASGEDVLPLLPDAEHRVGAMVIGFHQQARTPLGAAVVGGRTVKRAVWSPVPSSRLSGTVAFRDLTRQLGW